MLYSLMRWTAAAGAAALRDLWSGGTAARLGVIGGLLLLTIVGGGLIGEIAARLGGVLLLLGALIAVFALAVRGR